MSWTLGVVLEHASRSIPSTGSAPALGRQSAGEFFLLFVILALAACFLGRWAMSRFGIRIGGGGNGVREWMDRRPTYFKSGTRTGSTPFPLQSMASNGSVYYNSASSVSPPGVPLASSSSGNVRPFDASSTASAYSSSYTTAPPSYSSGTSPPRNQAGNASPRVSK